MEAWVHANGSVAVFGVEPQYAGRDSSVTGFVPLALLPDDTVRRALWRLGVFGTRDTARVALQLQLVRKGWRRL